MGLFRILWAISLVIFILSVIFALFYPEMSRIIFERKNKTLKENIELMMFIFKVIYYVMPISLICFLSFVVCDALLHF